ncbi:MAG: P-type conjugative transfer protein TrbJ [Pseudomonadota bacterium]
MKTKLIAQSIKKLIIALAILPAVIFSIHANAVFCGNCATEWTQIMNNIKLAASYAQQVQQYQTQLQQYQTQLTNMRLNPASVMPDKLDKLINGIGKIMSAGNSIGDSMAEVDANFSKTYKDKLTGTYAENFRTWTESSQDTLGAAMRAAGMHRDAYASDSAALSALFAKSQTSQGTGAALQTLSEINVSQIQHTQKLENLISSQTLAQSTYMAEQNAKQQANDDANERIGSYKLDTYPSASHSKF